MKQISSLSSLSFNIRFLLYPCYVYVDQLKPGCQNHVSKNDIFRSPLEILTICRVCHALEMILSNFPSSRLTVRLTVRSQSANTAFFVNSKLLLSNSLLSVLITEFSAKLIKPPSPVFSIANSFCFHREQVI